jgi:hypothetical protein
MKKALILRFESLAGFMDGKIDPEWIVNTRFRRVFRKALARTIERPGENDAYPFELGKRSPIDRNSVPACCNLGRRLFPI